MSGVTRPEGSTFREIARLKLSDQRVGAALDLSTSRLMNERLHAKHGRAVLPNHDPWKVLVGGWQTSKGGNLAGMMALSNPPRFLYYNGRGQLCAKRKNAPGVFTFGGEVVTSPASFAYDVLEFRNTVTVTGGVPKGLMKDHPDSKRRVRPRCRCRRTTRCRHSASLATASRAT